MPSRRMWLNSTPPLWTGARRRSTRFRVISPTSRSPSTMAAPSPRPSSTTSVGMRYLRRNANKEPHDAEGYADGNLAPLYRRGGRDPGQRRELSDREPLYSGGLGARLAGRSCRGGGSRRRRAPRAARPVGGD